LEQGRQVLVPLQREQLKVQVFQQLGEQLVLVLLQQEQQELQAKPQRHLR